MMTRKLVIKSTEERADDGYTRSEFWLDGMLIGKGHYGGEPEDNLKCRDYDWVETIITRVAKGLGAEVSEEVLADEEEEDDG